MLRTVVLVSGGGTNLQAIIDGVKDGGIRGTAITGVISNNRGVKAIERARLAGIPCAVVSPRDYASRDGFHAGLMGKVAEFGADLIVLAGFLVAIPVEMVKAYPGRIINIHPSLIPSFCGKGYYGLKVHEAALGRGVRITGATVHFVDEGTDTGPIILQKAVSVKLGDTPEILQKRVMEEAEWVILPKAIDMIAMGMVRIVDGKVIVEEE